MKTQITSNSTAVVQDLFTFHPDIVLADEQLPLSSMAEAGSPGLSFDFKFTKGPAIETYVGDITVAKADMLVVPEGVSFKGLGYIGRQMMKLSPKFGKSREKLMSEKKNKFAAWETYTSTLNSKLFKHVIHAIVVPCPDQNVEEWSNKMHLLYQRIFQEADRKIATVLAVPLLGTGRGGGRLEDVIDAAVNSVASFKQSNLQRILFVSNKPEIVVQIASRCDWELAHGGQGKKWRPLENGENVTYSKAMKARYSSSKASRPSSGKPKTGSVTPDFKDLQSTTTKTPRPQSAAGRKGQLTGRTNEQTSWYTKGSKRREDQNAVVKLSISGEGFHETQKSNYPKKQEHGGVAKTNKCSKQSRGHFQRQQHNSWEQQEEFDFNHYEHSGRKHHTINAEIEPQINHPRRQEYELNWRSAGGPKWLEHQSEDQGLKLKQDALKRVNANFNRRTIVEEVGIPQGMSDSYDSDENAVGGEHFPGYKGQSDFNATDDDAVGDDKEEDDSTSTASDHGKRIDTSTSTNVHSSLKVAKIRESCHNVVVEGRHKGRAHDESRHTPCGEQLQGRHYPYANNPQSTTTFQMKYNTEPSFGHLKTPGSKELPEDDMSCPQGRGAIPKDTTHESTSFSPEDTCNSVDSPEQNICPICICEITDKKILEKCGHAFCRNCIDNSFQQFKPVCPSCNMVYGEIRGNQPDGQMDVGFSGEHLPGYEGHGTITITYYFPSGTQGVDHPHPGQPFKGTTRRAYLPDNKEGKEVLKLLRKAFDRKITFTIGRSTTTGQENVVTWNDIHHKTNKDGGPTRFGYPDKTYLQRVREELASKGVTST